MPDPGPGELALVLHTHMPYVEGFGTWPFGEEWLWEAMATSYLPLLDVLERDDAEVTLSLTPVLCDQLEAPGIAERFLTFLRDVRAETHRRDIEGSREGAPARVPSMSRRCVSARTSRRKATNRSATPGASSWSQSTGVSESVIAASSRPRTSSSGR